jgi:hypothetical protein
MTVRFNYELTPQQHADVVLGKQSLIPRAVAINLLPGSAVEEPERLLGEVLLNRAENQGLRKLAANTLWRMNTPEGRRFLLEAGEQLDDPEVLTPVVKALGRVGDARALAALERIQKFAKAVLAEQTSFAASLITYRLGLPGHDLPVPTTFEPLPPAALVGMDFVEPRAEEVSLYEQALAGEPYGIKVAAESLRAFSCPGGRWMLGFNGEVLADEPLPTLLRRKTLFGLLASKNSEDGRYSVSYLLLSAPETDKAKVNLLLPRVTGELAWAGAAEANPSGVAKFALHAAGSLGIVPIEVEGTIYADGRIAFGRALTSGRVLKHRQPERMAAPSAIG